MRTSELKKKTFYPSSLPWVNCFGATTIPYKPHPLPGRLIPEKGPWTVLPPLSYFEPDWTTPEGRNTDPDNRTAERSLMTLPKKTNPPPLP